MYRMSNTEKNTEKTEHTFRRQIQGKDQKLDRERKARKNRNRDE